MQIELKMGDGYKAMIDRLGSMAKNLKAAVDTGLKFGAIEAASHIAQTRLTGQDLDVRSGRLRRAIAGGLVESGTAFVGIEDDSVVKDYAWLLMGETKTITPKRAKRLAIPLAAALTPTGQPRYPEGPRSIEGLFYLKTKKGTELLMLDKDRGTDRGNDKRFKNKTKKKRRLVAMFVLKSSVTITASNALPDGVGESLPNMTARIQAELDKLTMDNG